MDNGHLCLIGGILREVIHNHLYMERMPEGDLSEQMRDEAWETRKKRIMSDPDFHLDPEKLSDQTKIEPETLH